MAGSAQGAVDSLLGSLTSVLLDEAKLLGSVRGDIQFIKDEMESMSAFLMATVDSDPGHQVRAWMKQVCDLAYDSQECIDLYKECLAEGPHDMGLLGFVRRTLQSLRTIPTRHWIATRIRELKVRARDVGERRLRYGVQDPDARTKQPTKPAPKHDDEELQQDDRRRALVDVEAECFRRSVDEVIKWLEEKSGDEQQARCRVIPIVGWFCLDENAVARGVYKHSSMAGSFDCKAWVRVGKSPHLSRVLVDILSQVLPPEDELSREGIQFQTWSEEQLGEKLKGRLNGKRFLVVLEDVCDESEWSYIESALPDCSVGSAIILTTVRSKVASSCSPYRIFDFHDATTCPDNFYSLNKIFEKRVDILLAKNPKKDDLFPVIWLTLLNCIANGFSRKMFLHVLYINPYRTKEELLNLANNLHHDLSKADDQMLMLCYNELPSHYKICFHYLSIFPRGRNIRRTSLVRRWVVEDLISTRNRPSTLDEAERCFNALVDRGFVYPSDMGAAGKIKTCGVHDKVLDFAAEIARDENLVDMNLPLNLACRLSIRSGTRLRRTDDIKVLLESLPTPSRLGLLKVLDLEGCTGLKKRHLKNICNKILQLKYLSLRNTDATDLPEQINKLQYLETLDIRQTKIKEFPRKVVLPRLKHLLAGRTDCQIKDTIRENETFSTVYIPLGIRSKKNLEILSHVKVSHSDKELIDVGQLLQLRKLGVVLCGKKAYLKHLLRVIYKLNKCLRSLSIRIESSVANGDIDEMNRLEFADVSPKFLQSLNISGISSIELLPWIKHLNHLAKITLRETHLTDDNLRMLGRLGSLRCLRLWGKTYFKSQLAFAEGEFQNLKFLVIEGSEISGISFVIGAGPKLEKMVWSFTKMGSLFGIEHLPSLKELKLNGNIDVDQVKKHIEEAIKKHGNHLLFIHNH